MREASLRLNTRATFCVCFVCARVSDGQMLAVLRGIWKRDGKEETQDVQRTKQHHFKMRRPMIFFKDRLTGDSQQTGKPGKFPRGGGV